MNIPFTYHIAWSKENLHYYGVRYAMDCNPKDLWTKYFTSSKRVQELRESLGEPDIIEVRKTFDTIEQSCLWESRVLKKLNVVFRDDWINKCVFPLCNADGKNNPFYGKKHSIESRKKISKSLIGNKRALGTKKSLEERKQMSKRMVGNTHTLGLKHSETSKEKMSVNNKGENNPMYNRQQTNSTKEKISNTLKEYWKKRKNINVC